MEMMKCENLFLKLEGETDSEIEKGDKFREK